MTTLTFAGTLIVHKCWCGIGHAIPSELDDQARHNGQTVYCPLGHAWVIHKGQSFAKQLAAAQKEAENARAESERRRQLLVDERDQHKRTERRLVATRGVVTRTKRRIAAGACPKCHARFPDLKEHMHAEHPEYVQHLANPMKPQ